MKETTIEKINSLTNEYAKTEADKQILKLELETLVIQAQLGQLGGLMTAKKYGSKHYSEAGKKGMEKRWGKSNNLLKEK